MKKIWNKIRNIVCKKQMVEEKNEATTTIDAESFPKLLDAWCESSADGETTAVNGLLQGSSKKLAMTLANRISEDKYMHELIQRAMTFSTFQRIANHK